MFSKYQCDKARKATGRYDMKDEYINEEYDNLSAEEKEKITNDLWQRFESKNDLSGMDIYEVSAKYFTSEPVLFCLFKEHQAKLGS